MVVLKDVDRERGMFLRARENRENAILAGVLAIEDINVQREVAYIVGGDGFAVGDGGKYDRSLCWKAMRSILSTGEAVTPDGLLDALLPLVKREQPDAAWIAERYQAGLSTTAAALLTMAHKLDAMNRREKLASMFMDTAGRMFDLDVEPDDLLHKVVERAGYGKRSPLKCITLGDMIGKQYPAREPLLTPLICKKDLLMAYAKRGIGKTYFALTLAVAIAVGGNAFGRWSAPSPARVLYLDGEMPARTMQGRLASIIAGMGKEPDGDMLRIVTPDEQDGPMPNLATPEGQAEIEPFLDGVALVVIDNLATLCRTKDSFKEDAWGVVQSWILDLRRRGMAVLLIHHAGKNGDQRGTIAKEDVLDCVLNLTRPDDYKASEGARFRVHFTKARNLVGDDAEPFEALLVPDDRGGSSWATKTIADDQDDELVAMYEAGMNQRQMAQDLHVNVSTVSRRLKALREAGRIKAKSER